MVQQDLNSIKTSDNKGGSKDDSTNANNTENKTENNLENTSAPMQNQEVQDQSLESRPKRFFNQDLSAKKLLVKHLLNARFIQEPNKPSIAETGLGLAKRVNVIGIVVFKDNSTIVIDDSTGSIVIRFLPEHQLKKAVLGSCVQVIGRLRHSPRENYISGEFLSVINKSWLSHRLLAFKDYDENINESVSLTKKADIIKTPKTIQQPYKTIHETQKLEGGLKEESVNKQKQDDTSLELQILNIISSMDTGSGVKVQDIQESLTAKGFKTNNFEIILQHMIEKGLVFEIRPGLLKTL